MMVEQINIIIPPDLSDGPHNLLDVTPLQVHHHVWKDAFAIWHSAKIYLPGIEEEYFTWDQYRLSKKAATSKSFRRILEHIPFYRKKEIIIPKEMVGVAIKHSGIIEKLKDKVNIEIVEKGGKHAIRISPAKNNSVENNNMMQFVIRQLDNYYDNEKDLPINVFGAKSIFFLPYSALSHGTASKEYSSIYTEFFIDSLLGRHKCMVYLLGFVLPIMAQSNGLDSIANLYEVTNGQANGTHNLVWIPKDTKARLLEKYLPQIDIKYKSSVSQIAHVNKEIMQRDIADCTHLKTDILNLSYEKGGYLYILIDDIKLDIVFGLMSLTVSEKEISVKYVVQHKVRSTMGELYIPKLRIKNTAKLVPLI